MASGLRRSQVTVYDPAPRCLSQLPGRGPGEVTEWPIVLVSKTSVGASSPRVRIPPSPLDRVPKSHTYDGSWVFAFWTDRLVIKMMRRCVLQAPFKVGYSESHHEG